MKPIKICVYCHESFVSTAFHHRRQQACPKPECQWQRRRDTNRTYSQTHRSDRDYQGDKNKTWRKKHGRAFMRQYRKDHPAYVKKNRQQQHRRDRKKTNLVKSDVRTSHVPCGTSLSHGTTAQANEMADGVERDGGVRDETPSSESGVPVVDDFPNSVIPT